MCWIKTDDVETREFLDYNDWCRLIDDLRTWKPRLTITGGEPLLVDYVPELIRYAAGKGLRINLGTNGTRLGEYADELVFSGLQDLSVSLDGPQEVHDRIRGMTGVFDKVQDGIRRVVDAKRRVGSKLPYVRLNCTLTKANQESLQDGVTLAEEWGVDSVSFQHMWFTTSEIIERHNHGFRQVFGQESPDLTGFLVKDLAPDPDVLQQELGKLGQVSRQKLPVYVYPELDAAQLLKFYREPEYAFRSVCRSRWFRTDVMPNGDITPCLSYMVGNVRQTSFSEIWNNDRYQRFRRQLLKGLFPGCLRCCGLFSD
jgi:MoaA/NifB/PqqE/SkfB family radical SAM enzyme